jgi:membrane-bound ClpP family serine protease
MFSNAQAGSAQAVQNAQATTDDAQKIYGNNVAQYDQYAQNRAASTQAAQKAAGDKVSQYGGKDAYDRWVAAGMPTDVDSWITQDQGQHVKVKG